MSKSTYLMPYLRSFLLLSLFTVIGITLHELGHHLFGIPSMMSLSKNWPIVAVTDENRNVEIIGTLAGPTINVILGYVGVGLFVLSNRNYLIKSIGWYCGLSNSVLAFLAAIINLIVDMASGKMVNDLQEVSKLLGMNILILPAIYVLFSLLPLIFFWSKRSGVAQNKAIFVLLLIGGWFTGGIFLMMLDAIVYIRYCIRC